MVQAGRQAGSSWSSVYLKSSQQQNRMDKQIRSYPNSAMTTLSAAIIDKITHDTMLMAAQLLRRSDKAAMGFLNPNARSGEDKEKRLRINHQHPLTKSTTISIAF
jgi:hypothetical protein